MRYQYLVAVGYDVLLRSATRYAGARHGAALRCRRIQVTASTRICMRANKADTLCRQMATQAQMATTPRYNNLYLTTAVYLAVYVKSSLPVITQMHTQSFKSC